ncbi:unnamed protein product [Aureobasidium vineae]|uniref:Uncharacterized protein n=1 Tax=Aureobasidium vineae TaxID=2773715 RepID=A0A9N8PIQ1_9PEZI|nr:unnamed protein product [Aureobasidium vineae]
MVLLARSAGRLLSARSPLLPKQHGARQYSIQAVIEHGCKGLPDYVALMPVTCLDSLHSIGLPWFAAIPLSAILIRSLLIYPLFQRPLREKLVARAQLQPLVDANMSITKRILYRRTTKGTQKSMAHKLNLTLESWRTRNRVRIAMFERSRLYGHRFFMFMTTIVVSDGLRRMMGAKEGLLKFVLGPLDWTLSWLVPSSLTETSPGEAEVSPASPVSNPVTNTGLDDLDPWSTGVPQGLSATETAQDATSGLAQEASTAVAGHLNSAWFDPSLLTEGFSWCPDLTASDPTMVFPLIFSSTFFASIYFAPRIQGTVTGSKVDERAKSTNGQRIMMTVAMLSIIPALHMPTGLLLYFISNMVTNNLQSRWLTYTKPIHPAPTACKRPVRMQRYKEIPEEMLPNKARPNARQ